MNNEIFEKILAEIRCQNGIDLRGYRRPMLERRIAAHQATLGLFSIESYWATLAGNGAMVEDLLGTIAINVSSFFRDPFVFEMLAGRVLPRALEALKANRRSEFRVWSAGSAAGEEAYSIAILLHKLKSNRFPEITPLVFATDIDQAALATSANATYKRQALASTKLGIIDQYFSTAGEAFVLEHGIQSMVQFSRDDLLAPGRFAPPASIFGDFDLVLCRNVIIYMEPLLQEQVQQRLCQALVPGGVLVLGMSESLADALADQFDAIDEPLRIYRKRK